jgi:hypothetical protein
MPELYEESGIRKDSLCGIEHKLRRLQRTSVKSLRKGGIDGDVETTLLIGLKARGRDRFFPRPFYIFIRMESSEPAYKVQTPLRGSQEK